MGDRTALYGLFCGPYTLASHLRGTNFFRDARQHPEYVKELMAYTTELGLQMADFYLEEGVDVIVPGGRPGRIPDFPNPFQELRLRALCKDLQAYPQ